MEDCSWAEVLKYIEDAKKTYAAKADNNPIRRFIRGGDAVAGILERMTDFIPDEKGLSVLKGALAFIFQVGGALHILIVTSPAYTKAQKAWQKRVSNKYNILQELDDIPSFMSKAYQMCASYRGDNHLLSLVLNLYETLLSSLRRLVDILNRNYKDSNCEMPHKFLREHG